MKQKIIDWLDGLIWMKLWAAIILGVCSYWIFSDREVTFNTVLYLPWIYFYITDLYITKKIVVLLVPLLMNIALWVPCYVSYIFIRVVLYAERIIAIAWAVYTFGLLLLGRLFGAYGSVTDLLIISGICILFNELILYKFQTEAYKEKFSAKLKTEQAITPLLRKLAPIFYLAVYLLLSGENLQQDSLPEIYAPIETRNFINKEFKVKIRNEIRIEKEMPKLTGRLAKISQDEKLLLVKFSSYDDENKKIFVFNLDDMQNIHILKTNDIKSDYEFTIDNKYIIVGNKDSGDRKIKFTVLDTVTSEIDTRFRDQQGLLEKSPNEIERVPFIRFNPSGDYFAVISRIKYNEYRLEFWDYKQGTLIYSEVINGKVEEIIWSSDKKCIILYQRYEEEIEQLYNDKPQSFYNKITNKKVAFLEQREILSNGSILSTTKEKITADIQEKEWSQLLEKSDFLDVDCNGKYISILINEKEMKVWDLDTGKGIFSLNSDNKIQDLLFHPDGKEFIVFEILKDQRTRITFWDIFKDKKKRTLLLPSTIMWNGNARLIDNGNKVLLIGSKVNIVFLEE